MGLISYILLRMTTLLPFMYPLVYPAITFYTIKTITNMAVDAVINTVVSKTKSGIRYILSYPFKSSEVSIDNYVLVTSESP